MKLIKEKYRRLEPTSEYLGDEVVMAQAWKKTHTYMRTHNWYADTLALDVSALALEGNIRNWAFSSIDAKAKLEPMELVPAAKTEQWVFDDKIGWCSKREIKAQSSGEKPSHVPKLPLRPLAHLTVRDQTWATAAMLCLADSVEIAQGDCSEKNFFKAQRKGVFSYGNRLICDWREERNRDTARFRWGNGLIYRKFFTDYQNFLRRPIVIGKDISRTLGSESRVYIVSLDLSKFYDNIDRDLLIKKLRSISGSKTKSESNDQFWRSLRKITNWRWDEQSLLTAEKLGLDIEDNAGLPQGLVAAGFFANAYLNDFDNAVGKNLGQSLPAHPGIVVHDYCRYVDDIRLVVSIEDDDLYPEINRSTTAWMRELIAKHTTQALEFNPGKTKVASLVDLANRGSFSARIENLQHELSGPADRDILDNTMGVLEGILSLRPDEFPPIEDSSPDANLVRMCSFDHDIRLDTLKRFAANRLEMIMRNKRRIDVPVDGDVISDIDNESELLAKKLIWAWIQDPSLVLLLRKALEICPLDELVEPIFEALYKRSTIANNESNDVVSAAIADYVLADLFRCCIDFHSYFQRVEYPSQCNPIDLLELSCRFAQKVSSAKAVPKFLRRQALLLLAVMEKSAHIDKESNSFHDQLLALLAGSSPPVQHQYLALYEIASQITGAPKTFAVRCLESTETQPPETQRKILNELAKRGGPFWDAVWDRVPKHAITNEIIDELWWAQPNYHSVSRTNKQLLEAVIYEESRPFSHELAIVKLGLALVQLCQNSPRSEEHSPAQIQLKKNSPRSWARLYTPSSRISCSLENTYFSPDPRYVTPSWIKEEPDHRHIYWIGTILRAAATASSDYTEIQWKPSQIRTYKGLRTGWYKRRMGMMHSPEALVGEFATLSNWTAELLMKCLQWPGFEATFLSHEDLKSFDNIEELKSVLTNREKLLTSMYCNGIDAPALVTKTNRPPMSDGRMFRLVSVQQILPRVEDFSASDPCMNNLTMRRLQRNHLARICHLTLKTLEAKLAVEEYEKQSSADLIVFPELSVHPDDQDLLKRLADKTRSMIFAGMLLQEHDGGFINLARWIIPDYRDTGRQWIIRDQGKANPIPLERKMKVHGYRPCQHIIEVDSAEGGPHRLSGAICYDATDLHLAADLKDKSDLFVVVAHNKDVTTFDTMASALNYHMYQHVVVVNKGEFGGSTIQAPYREHFHRLVSHSHGADQISIHIADLDLAAFKRKSKKHKEVKTPPASTKP